MKYHGQDEALDIVLTRSRALRDRVPDASGEALFLASVAADLAQWPARNPVVRQALDRACDELLRLAQVVAIRPAGASQPTTAESQPTPE